MRGFDADEQERIINLRKSGCGYTEVAKRLECKADKVKKFCRTNGLSGVTRKQEDSKAVCECCGVAMEMSTIGRPRKFCSSECRYKGYQRQLYRTVTPIRCKYCGAFFTPQRRSQIYCSQDCCHDRRMKSPEVATAN